VIYYLFVWLARKRHAGTGPHNRSLPASAIIPGTWELRFGWPRRCQKFVGDPDHEITAVHDDSPHWAAASDFPFLIRLDRPLPCMRWFGPGRCLVLVLSIAVFVLVLVLEGPPSATRSIRWINRVIVGLASTSTSAILRTE
jgi:hypothetical protein